MQTDEPNDSLLPTVLDDNPSLHGFMINVVNDPGPAGTNSHCR